MNSGGDLSAYDPFDLMDAEAARIDRFYAGLSDEEWAAATRLPGWDRRALLAHLDAMEEYTRAGLDGTVAELTRRAGPGSLDDFNAWGIERRDGLGPGDLLDAWRAHCGANRRDLRARGVDGELDTAVGAYPVGRQACYLACELAIHADDAGVPEESVAEHAQRTRWRAWFGRQALAEAASKVTVVVEPGAHEVTLNGESARLTDDDFVAATSGRLAGARPVPPALREALVVLA